MPIPSLHTECPPNPFTVHDMPTRRDDEQLADVQTTPNAGGLHSNSKHEPIASLIPFPSIPSNCMPTQNPTRRMPFPSVPSTCPSHLFTPRADPIPSHRMPCPSLHSGCPSNPSHALSIPSHRMPSPSLDTECPDRPFTTHSLPIPSHRMQIPALPTECPARPFTAHALTTRKDDTYARTCPGLVPLRTAPTGNGGEPSDNITKDANDVSLAILLLVGDIQPSMPPKPTASFQTSAS